MPRLPMRVHRSAAYFRVQAIGGAWPGAGPEWGRFRPQDHARMVPPGSLETGVYGHQSKQSWSTLPKPNEWPPLARGHS